jgi:hypothetical protein
MSQSIQSARCCTIHALYTSMLNIVSINDSIYLDFLFIYFFVQTCLTGIVNLVIYDLGIDII